MCKGVKRATYTVNDYFKIIGIVSLIIALIIFWKSHYDLGKQFSHTLQVKEQHELIKTGIYSYVRHPMYFAALFGFVAVSTLMPNYASVASFAFAVLLLILVRIPAEESMLKNEFGNEYQKYMNETCGVIPYLCKFLLRKN